MCGSSVDSLNNACFTFHLLSGVYRCCCLTGLTAVTASGKPFVHLSVCVCLFTLVMKLQFSGESPRANHSVCLDTCLCIAPSLCVSLCIIVCAFVLIFCKAISLWISQMFSVSFFLSLCPFSFSPSLLHILRAQTRLEFCFFTLELNYCGKEHSVHVCVCVCAGEHSIFTHDAINIPCLAI